MHFRAGRRAQRRIAIHHYGKLEAAAFARNEIAQWESQQVAVLQGGRDVRLQESQHIIKRYFYKSIKSRFWAEVAIIDRVKGRITWSDDRRGVIHGQVRAFDSALHREINIQRIEIANIDSCVIDT